MENIFDMIKVRLGDEEVLARPFAFATDENGDFLYAEKAITVCPNCGQGLEVAIDHSEEITDAVCSNCGIGSHHVYEVDRSIMVTLDEVIEDMIEDDEINTNKQKVEVDHKDGVVVTYKVDIDDNNDEYGNLTSNCTFVDPVALGTFIEEDL